MVRILLIAIAIGSLSASPAFSQTSRDQQKQIQKRESTGESVTQNQRGGLKKDRQISRKIFRNAHARVRERWNDEHR
jgi:Ni/Co efflux regulator RcnB